MLVSALTKAFQSQLEDSFFEGWVADKPREFWLRDSDYRLGIDLQLGKYWQKTGGEVAVNLWCGHKWKYPAPIQDSDGFEYYSRRLGAKDIWSDHWWSVTSEQDVNTFDSELASHIKEAIPWFIHVTTKKGFFDWHASVYPEFSCFRYVLELHGKKELKKHVRRWLTSAPRQIDETLDWLTEVDVLTGELSERIRRASIQSADTYRHKLSLLLDEFA